MFEPIITMPRVIIESPYRAVAEEDPIIGIQTNESYLDACILDSLGRGEAPFASHAIYTRVLRDSEPQERTQGIRAGLQWHSAADLVAVYVDRGVSEGMRLGIKHAESLQLHIDYRKLGAHWGSGDG
jgi:hypothetical protein